MPETIEAEVIEIDGGKPPNRNEAEPESVFRGQGARKMVLRLDRRWWPLWAVLGIFAVVLLATIGVVFGALLLVWAIVRRILRFVLGGSISDTSQTGELRRGA